MFWAVDWSFDGAEGQVDQVFDGQFAASTGRVKGCFEDWRWKVKEYRRDEESYQVYESAYISALKSKWK